MKFLLISQDERNVFLLQQLEQEHNEVMLLCKQNSGAWSGLIPRANSLADAMQWGPDMVLVDSPGFGSLVRKMQQEGLNVFGGGQIQDRLATDYLFGMSMLQNAGVPTSDYQEFRDIVDAAEYIQGTNQPWYFRFPDGSGRGTQTTAEMQGFMEDLFQAGKVPERFTLQKGFPAILNAQLMLRPEFYLVGLFNNRGLMNPALAMWLSYGLLPDGQGVPTVEGVTLYPLSTDESIPQQILKPLEQSLRVLNYTGFVFFGCITEPGGFEEDYRPQVRVVDFFLTPPEGFWAALCKGLQGNLSLQFFLDRAFNPRRDGTPYEFFQGYSVSRLLTVPPYPLTEAGWLTPEQRLAVAQNYLPNVGMPARQDGVYWNEVASGDEGALKVVGPKVGYVLGRAPEYYDAMTELRNTAGGLPIPFRQCKVDSDPTFGYDMLTILGLNPNRNITPVGYL